ncbi:MAG: anthranilate phosphoribosyltransferase, partial [Actinobacteria bacterium]|nr:anthranilate phosphoribosyltransferase [Actinomycetota bacterium]
FAPRFHAGLRHAGPTRGELAVPTVFNFLGPLTNPGRVTASAIGCADARMAPVMAAVLADRGDTALVFRGDDGLDELTTTTTSSVWVAADGEVSTATVDPEALGIAPVPPEALRGGDRVFNARVVREVLGGGAPQVRDVVLLNAAAAIASFDGLGGVRVHDALARGLRIGAEAIDSGAASSLLDRWIASSQAAR